MISFSPNYFLKDSNSKSSQKLEFGGGIIHSQSRDACSWFSSVRSVYVCTCLCVCVRTCTCTCACMCVIHTSERVPLISLDTIVRLNKCPCRLDGVLRPPRPVQAHPVTNCCDSEGGGWTGAESGAQVYGSWGLPIASPGQFL